MSTKKEVGKITILENNSSVTINLQQTYSSIPSIKVTTNKNINIFINNVTLNSFTVEKSSLEEAIIHYVVIGN